MHSLFLLDGMALVYRAHFAFLRAPITTSTGLNTSAVYGFANTLLDIIENHGASHIGVAFDTKQPTPRHKLYPEYKAQREAMPEELATAIPYVKKLCKAMGIPVLELDGYEADDIIGTIAHRADQQGDIHTYMVTPDKDFAQLVTPTTTMWKPGRKGGNHDCPPSASSGTSRSQNKSSTSSASGATPRTTSPACPASVRKPPKNSSHASAPWRHC